MIAGKILSPSAVRAWMRGSDFMSTVVEVAVDRVTSLHVPALAVMEALEDLPTRRVEQIRARLDDPVFVCGVLDLSTALVVKGLTARWEGMGMTPAEAHTVLAADGVYAGCPVIVEAGSVKRWRTWLPDTPLDEMP
ncbi:hypothetical protein O4J56_14105 [Nocardiopsis sp. RSe5-2]|uniref:Uncharacterized protein n=1 Tax=Nocardiopsis endophytica TaxID=3018445 RepID=A0ABT4U488_9ACTN|nr:hypothetical protein [Nocardiopsis endophytica]MDA2811771.1 hypothetical protein [Nocardiopsis endophytica]